MTTTEERVEVRIEGPDGEDTVTLPGELLDMLAEEGDTSATVVGDLAVMSCAQRIHATVHHAEGEVDEHLEEVEGTALDLFEDRFGMTFGEATGHQH
jgi:high-affinity K+ transport system ATPase subunit B